MFEGLLVLLGYGLIIIAAVWMIIVTFRQGILWGVLCLFIWPVALVFVILHWHLAKGPVFLNVMGLGLVFVGTYLHGG